MLTFLVEFCLSAIRLKSIYHLKTWLSLSYSFSLVSNGRTMTKSDRPCCIELTSFRFALRYLPSCQVAIMQEVIAGTTDRASSQLLFFSFLFFIYLWLHWVFVAVRGLSLVAVRGGQTSLRCTVFSLRWPLLLWSMGSRHASFSSCGTWAQQLWLVGSIAQAQQLWRTGLVAPRHVGSSPDQGSNPCLLHWQVDS